MLADAIDRVKTAKGDRAADRGRRRQHPRSRRAARRQRGHPARPLRRGERRSAPRSRRSAARSTGSSTSGPAAGRRRWTRPARRPGTTRSPPAPTPTPFRSSSSKRSRSPTSPRLRSGSGPRRQAPWAACYEQQIQPTQQPEVDDDRSSRRSHELHAASAGAAVALALLAAACMRQRVQPAQASRQRRTRQSTTFTYDTYTPVMVDGWDPATEYSNGIIAMSNMYETLTRYNPATPPGRAAARDQLVVLVGRPDLDVPAPPRRALPHRPADDRAGGQGGDRAHDQAERRRRLHLGRGEDHRHPEPVHAGVPPASTRRRSTSRRRPTTRRTSTTPRRRAAAA